MINKHGVYALIGVISISAAQAQDTAVMPSRVFGGPDGVSEELQRSEQPDAVYGRVKTVQSWSEWKAQLKEDSGVSFGLGVILNYQTASDVLPLAEDDAGGGIYRFNGSWELYDRGGDNPGRLEWRVENRSNLGSLQSPRDLGGAVGTVALNSGFGYSSNFDTDIAVLNWTQLFNDSRGGFAVGRLAFDVYLDAFMFQTFSRGFLNRSFVVNPTLGTTGVGAIGGVAKGFVSDHVWIGGQIHDGNAASGDFDWDTVEQREWLGAGEIGWAPAIDRYKTDRVQLTYWHKDSRRKARVPEGHGVALSASYQVAPGVIPFTRIGISDGGAGVAAKRAASVGVEYAVRPDQALSVGIGWADPSKKTHGKTLGDEYVFETSYRFQLTPTLSIMPDLQLLKDPAMNPREDYVWVGSLRANIAL